MFFDILFEIYIKNILSVVHISMHFGLYLKSTLAV